MSFTLDVANFVKKAKKNPETVMRQVSIKLFTAIIKGSPVDTGRFRMNWQISNYVPAEGIIDAVDKTGNNATGRVENFALSSGEWQTFTLTNNLPYAERLEYGYSNQAPSGMVRVNVARFNTLLAQEAAKVK